MAVGKTLLILVGLLVPLCLSAVNQNILFGNLAATLVPQPAPRNPTLELRPLNVNDPNQLWNTPPTPGSGYIQSANPAYPNHVWDVSGSSTAANAKVILYPKPTTGPVKKNQNFSISATGVISNALAAGFTAAPNGTSNVKMVYGTPTPATVQTAVTTPWRCSSTGDPHITPYPGGRNDIYSPGSHQPGTFTLSKTGLNGDPDYQVIQADQQACLPHTPTIYCNKRGIIRTNGQVIEVKGDTVTINGIVVPIVGMHTVGSGVTVTKLGRSNYRVDYPTGSTQFVSPLDWYLDIYISVNAGRRPTGGLCTPLPGPNTAKRSVTPVAFCISWRTPNKSDDLFHYSSELAWREANPLTYPTSNGNLTTTNTTLRNAAIELCSPLAPGSSLATQCTGFLDAAAFHQACLDDVIGTGEYSLSASNVDAFSKKCSSNAGSTPITLPTSARNTIASGPGLANVISQSNTPVTFDITAKDANGNPVTTTDDNFVVTTTVGTITSVAPIAGSPGQYRVTYTPSDAGTRTIHVLYGGVANINNSPWTVNVESTQTDPSKSTIALPSVIYTGTNAFYTVTARTSSGAPRTSGGDTVVATFLDGAGLTPLPTNNGDGTYSGSFMQNRYGDFKLQVTINGGAIQGSPFSLFADESKK